MKVVRKQGCTQDTMKMSINDIKRDTVFSGRPNGYTDGVFYRCEEGCVRIAYKSGEKCDGVLFENGGTVEDYKELNAYLCIKE